MLDKKDKEIIKEIIKGETQDLRSNVLILKEDVVILKEDVKDLKKDVVILKEDVKDLKKDVVILKEDVKDLKEDVTVLKEDNVSIKETLRGHGIIMEDMNSKMDLILENVIQNNEKIKDYNELKEKVYQNHEIRIKALEFSVKKIK